MLPLSLFSIAALSSPPAFTHRTLRFDGAPVEVLVLPPGSDVEAIAAQPGKSVPAWAAATGALAAINGGYFNHSDDFPVSAVRSHGRDLTDPRRNRALITNPVLRPILPLIFDRRVEWRADAAGHWTIVPHDTPGTVVEALQAGPALLPQRDLAAEGFQIRGPHGRVVRDGIGSTSRAARSALGLTTQGEMLWVAVGKPGLTIPQVADLMRTLGASEAMGLDGGSSTTLTWKTQGRYHTFLGQNPSPARVNSVLLFKAPARVVK